MTIHKEQKTEYAIQLLKFPGERLLAARNVFGDDPKTLPFVFDLADDEFVKFEMERLLKQYGEEYFLPSKVDVARLVYSRITRTDNLPVEDFARLAKLFCEIRGFIEKPGSPIGGNNTTNITQHSVMVVVNKGNDEDWARGLADQQRKLVDRADARLT